MGARIAFVDDLDGSNLPEEKANKVTFAVNGTQCRLDLGSASLKSSTTH